MRLPLDYKNDVPRSVRNLSHEKRTTFNAGVVIPIMFEKIYPNDKFEINFATLLQSNPLVAPLMGQYVLQTNFFFEPDSNLYGWLDNNDKLISSEILSKERHTLGPDFLPVASSDSFSDSNPGIKYPCVYRGSLLDYLGVSPCSVFPSGWFDTNDICADRLLAYLDIIRTYYMPSQTISVPFINNLRISSSNQLFVKREDLDGFFKYLRMSDDGVNLTDNFADIIREFPTVSYLLSSIHYGGLFCSPYLPDMMRNLLLNLSSSKIKVDVENNAFSIDTLRFKNKLQRLVDRYDISGGRFSNWLRTLWGTNGGKRLDIPQLIGSTSLVIDPSNITSTANTYNNDIGSDIGQLAGNVNQSNFKSKDRNKNFDFYFSSNEPGTLVCCVTLIPKVDYSQGLDKSLRDILFADDYNPEFAQLGYQDVPMSNYSTIPNVADGNYPSADFLLDDVVGKQIAWMPLMSNVSRVHGEFSDGGYYESWVLRRRFTIIDDFYDDFRTIPKNAHATLPSYYVDPRDYTYMFANTDYGDDNFFFQIAFDIRAVRPIGKRFMPTLE